MAKDYAPNLATVKRLIRDKGRQVTFRKLQTTPPDAGTPWIGPTDPASPSSGTANAVAVFVPPVSASTLGMARKSDDLLASLSSVMIVEPGEDAPETLDTFNEVLDGGVAFKIEFTERLKPADLTLLYFVGLGR